MKKITILLTMFFCSATFSSSRIDNVYKKNDLKVSNVTEIDLSEMNLNSQINRLRKFFIVSDYMLDSSYEYGGYLMFRKDIENKVCSLKNKDAFYMLDHEGGRVNRINSDLISANKANSDNYDDYYSQWNKDLNIIKKKCINTILGPTVDINFGDRSYSKDLERNLKYTVPIVNSIEKKGMLPVLKHFPGEMMDCQEKFAKKEVRLCPQNMSEINEHWKNFKDSSYPAIMISNYIYRGASELPAVMDEKMYDYLRNELNYKGLVITDALWEMSVPITPNTIWEIFKNADLLLLINPEQVERMLPIITKRLLDMPKENRFKLIQEKELRIAKAKSLITNK